MGGKVMHICRPPNIQTVRAFCGVPAVSELLYRVPLSCKYTYMYAYIVHIEHILGNVAHFLHFCVFVCASCGHAAAAAMLHTYANMSLINYAHTEMCMHVCIRTVRV